MVKLVIMDFCCVLLPVTQMLEIKPLLFQTRRHALEEYQIVANSFRYQQQYTDKLFFALVDFDEAQDVFQQVSDDRPLFF